jgi:chromosome segregation ATPase
MPEQNPTFDDVSAAATRLQGEGQPVTIEAVRDALGEGSPTAIGRHLAAWRAEHVPKPALPGAEIPEEVATALRNWAMEFAEAAAASRDTAAQSENDIDTLLRTGAELEDERDALASRVSSLTALTEEQAEQIERLTVELRDARQVATDALVGKAKDQLAIDGKDRQIADLRSQLERSVTSSSTEADARLAAEMELVGATTARDNFKTENDSLRAQLKAANAERTALRAEVEGLRSRR